MRLAIRRSQLCRQRLPPALKQFEMHNPSEHTTAWAVEASIIIDARSINAATSVETRSMEILRPGILPGQSIIISRGQASSFRRKTLDCVLMTAAHTQR
jgi:hypothetical protein